MFAKYLEETFPANSMPKIRETLLMYWFNTLFKDWLQHSKFNVGIKDSALRTQLKTHDISNREEDVSNEDNLN